MSGASIKAIDRDSVHRLHSGQVVLDLQSAVKELVENAIDSGATSVDVRIKDHGLESVEVVDNGSGIDQADWPSIALKHHTSKLPSLEELANVSTFGFRGEALSALCALCESVTVVTATKETAPMGAVIKLARDGSVLDDSGRIARQRGTTVALTGLFVPLPVRRKEFQRTVKREFTKALGILTAYALVPASASEGKPGVRLKVESIGAGRGGKRNTVLATDGRGGLRSSVSAVWGPKALDGVVEIDLDLDVEVDKAMARREGITETSQTVRMTGLLSSPAWGQGRSSADRQFTYINGRPCNLPKVLKTINEVYKSYNSQQVPLAILDFQIPRESVDINVSPDKRTIFVHSEANLLEALRTELDTLFQPVRGTYAVGGASSTLKATQTVESETLEDEEPEAAERLEEEAEQAREQSQTDERPVRIPDLMESGGEDELPPSPQSLSRSSRSSASRKQNRGLSPEVIPLPERTLDTTVASWSTQRPMSSQRGAAAAQTVTIIRPQANASSKRSEPTVSSRKAARVEVDDDDEEDELEEDRLQPAMAVIEAPLLKPSRTPRRAPPSPPLSDEDIEMVGEEEPPRPSSLVQFLETSTRLSKRTLEYEEEEDGTPSVDEQPVESHNTPSMPTDNGVSFAQPDAIIVDDDEPVERDGYRGEIQSTATAGEATLRFDLAKLKKRYAARRTNGQPSQPSRNAFTALRDGAATKDAGISNRDADAAEEALARVISKDDFARMEVLGQFNKGFIIARLRHEGKSASDDLFIVDQHASDEKFNFETLQRTTVIKGQVLIRPRPMQLTAADEIVAMENLDVLKLNGFEVEVDEEAAPGRGERVALKAMPVSKETTFDFQDLEQLLHLLSDSARPAGQVVRCSRARTMFAMRACRRSVMIGKSLTKGQMATLLRNMGTIDQPWNCPHGRPTMRHVCTLVPPSKSRSGRDRIDWGIVNL